MSRVRPKRSEHELKHLIEAAVNAECDLSRPGLWICVDRVEVSGKPPESIRVWAILHFTSGGNPFCCGEPQCHTGITAERTEAISDRFRRALRLRQRVLVEFGDLHAVYHAGVVFCCVPQPERRHAGPHPED